VRRRSACLDSTTSCGAEVRVVHGRVALRFGPPSATQTAFVKDAELTALSRALGTSLVDRREE